MAVLDWINPDAGPSVEGEVVRLRAPRMADFHAWSKLRAESRAFLQPWEPTWPADDLTRAAYRRRLSIYTRDRELGQGHAQSAAVGYWAGAQHARQGYTLAALNALTQFAFATLGLHRLEAACCTDNQPSRRLLLKAGFSEEGIARSYLKINGIWRDHLTFGLIGDGSDTA
jgi:ribosomal-protein-alanine N-acetyltransferase